MGGKESKNCPVSYEDALSKVTDPELRRLRDAFRRCAGPNGNLSLNALHSDVLGGAVPRPIAEQIFSSLSGGKGMTFKDLLCLLVLITSGNRQERTQLLFNLYAGENGLVSYETLFRNALDEDREYLSHIRNTPPMSFAEFYRYICARPDTTVVSRWLLSTAPGLTISDDVETPTFYQTLAGVTHLEEKEIMSLEKKYWALNGRLDEDAFGRLVSPPVPEGVKSLLFRAFDENRDEQIDFKELACGVSAACCGPVAERHKFSFKVFDADGDGCLSEEEIRNMARGLLEARLEIRRGDPAGPGFFNDKPCEINECDIEEVVTAVQASCHDKDGKVKLQDYLVWALSSPLTVNFLSLLREVCIITLGLTPADREEEGIVVLRWLTREERRGLRAGAFLFLVDARWWREWSDYVSSPQSPHNDVLPHGASTNSISLASTNSSPAGSRYGSLKRGSAGKRLTSSTLASDSDSGVIMTSCQQIYPDDPSPVNSLSTLSSSRLARNGPSRSPSPMPSPKFCRRTPPCTPSPAIGAITRPGPIDNSCLLAPSTAKQAVPITGEGGRLRRNVERKRDYELVPDSLWKALNLWYGGGPALPRQVIYKDASLADDVEIELHPMFFKLWRHQAVKKPNGDGVNGNGNDQQPSALFSTYGLMAGYSPAAMGSGGLGYFPTLAPATPRRYLAYVAAFSRSATWQQVLTYICSRLRLQPEDVRLWLYRDENNLTLIEDELGMLERAGLAEEESLLIEVRDKDQTWPEEMSLLAKNPEVKIRANQPVAAGATGLNNLGNTCFLNAAVQCVSNTAPLTKYFLKDMHLYELNRENPLGMKGHVAKRYGDLIKDIWNGSSKTLAPIKLKYTIGRYAPRFNCFQQQDSQELLAFLLDGLHEDLNRVHVKPYATLKDSDGRPDIEVAQEAWENHVLRNKSIIVDLFHGQLKSKVTCKVCCHESVRFDPFTYLTLPLPMENFVRAEIILIRFDGSVPTKYGIRVEYEANFGTIKDELEKLAGVPSDRILLVQLSGPVIKEVIRDDFRVRDWSSFLVTGTLFGYEVADSRAESGKMATLNVPNGRPSIAPEPMDTSSTNDEPEMIPPTTSSSPSPSSASSTDSGPEAGLPEIRAPKIAVVYHRKTMRQDSYFLSVHKTKASLFGVPLVIPFPKGITNIELYEAVWVRVSRLVSPAPVVDSTGANHAQDCDDSLGYEFPFTLKAVNAEGTGCAWCHWYDFCRGCPIPPTDATFLHPSPQVLANNNPHGVPSMFFYFAVDWDPTAIHLRYQSGLERAFESHESVERTEREQNEPISLERCLEAFTKEEELGENEKYFCTKCKCHQLAKIKLEIWRLPPVLIIHLKRFQCVGNRWMKSHKLVRFPFTDFHPERFLASVPRTTVERHKSGFKEMAPAGSHPGVSRSVSVADTIPEEDKTREDEGMGDEEEMVAKDLKELRQGLQDVRRTLSGDGDNPPNSSTSSPSVPPPLPKRRRERLDSVTKCALNSTALQDFHQHKLKPESDPFSLTYDLYAVTKHSGIMGGGHYTCYAMNAMTKKWFFYNDSSCKEVDASQIDCDFAYILFYARRDVDEAQYLPTIPSNIKPPDVSDLEDELETDYRKYCSIM